jgi:glutamate carboxypeptidase
MRKISHTFAAIALTAMAASPAMANSPLPLQPPAAQISTFTATDRAYGEALLERLVNQNSGSLNLPGVRAVGAMMRSEFEALGFTVTWVDGAAWGRAGHLIATHHPGRAPSRRAGRGGKHVLLIGHLDTVFEPSSPFQRYEVSANGDRAVGPGVGDDKGGLVVIIQALRAMQAAGTLRDADIMVVLTGDEERVGDPVSAARAALISAGQWADAALEYENQISGPDGDFGTIARRSSSNWTLNVSARTGHSSTIFSDTMGYGAANELARILDSFRRELPEANLTFNVGVMAAGTPAALDADEESASASGKTNIVPQTAVARGDLRTLTVEQDARIRAAMAAIVAAHLPGTDASIRFDDGYPPMSPTAGNRALLATLNVANRQLALPEMAEYDPARRGAADSGFVAPYVDTLGGLGAVSSGAHAVGESINLALLPRQAARSALFISILSQQNRE